MGESFIAVLSRGAGVRMGARGEVGKEGESAQRCIMDSFSHHYGQEGAWYLQIIGKSCKKSSGFPSEGERSSTYVPASMSQWEKVHPLRVELHHISRLHMNSSRSLPPSQGPKSSWIGTLSGPDVRCCQVALVWSDQCPWTVWNMRLGGSGVVHSCPTKPIPCNTEICSCPSLCSSPYYVLRPSCFFVRISCSPSLKEERYKSDLPENPSRWRKAMVSAKI